MCKVKAGWECYVRIVCEFGYQAQVVYDMSGEK
jgi:hypothetical protein